MRRFVALLLPLCLCLPAAAAPRYTVTDLGPATYLDHVSINNRGQIVGRDSQAAMLRAGGKAVSLGTLPGYPRTFASAINDRGQIAGRVDNTTDGAIMVFDYHAVLWDRGKRHDLGAPDGFAISEANGLNNNGEVVGDATDSGHLPDMSFPEAVEAHQPHAFLYSHGTMTDLGKGVAHGINDKGQIVGGSGVEAVLWQGGQKQELGIKGDAMAINNKGQIVAGYGFQHVVLWQNGASHELPLLPGSSQTEANSINANGFIVGRAGMTRGSLAMLWHDGRVYDLNMLIPHKSTWVLEDATGINDKGQIVGSGTLNGQPHAFLLTPR